MIVLCIKIPHFHSSADGYLSCLRVLAVVNSVAVSTVVQISFRLDKCLGVGLLDIW